MGRPRRRSVCAKQRSTASLSGLPSGETSRLSHSRAPAITAGGSAEGAPSAWRHVAWNACGGPESGVATTLIPMPLTIARVRWPARRVSVRTPPIFRPRLHTSLGHLTPASAAPRSRQVRAAATPAAKLRRPRASRSTFAGRHAMEHIALAPSTSFQRVPRRPRPSVCVSATTTAGDPRSLRSSAAGFVEAHPLTIRICATHRSRSRLARSWP